MALEIFKIALRLKDRNAFMWQPLEVLNDFNYLTSKQVFCKTQIPFKILDYCFLVESTKTENATFPY